MVYPLEVLRISTVVDYHDAIGAHVPLEVLRISTVVDKSIERAAVVSLWKY